MDMDVVRARPLLPRCEVRLANLPHSVLVEIAAAGMRTSERARRVADEKLAEFTPLPEWAVSGVLLSSDLLPSILAHLPQNVRFMARVCTPWRDAWAVRVPLVRCATCASASQVR
jgi:hypothetical protein